MILSDPAQRVLSDLRRIPEAILFGTGEPDTPFKLIAGSESMLVPRHIVDELLSVGYLQGGEIGTRAEKVYVSFSLSDEGRYRFSRG